MAELPGSFSRKIVKGREYWYYQTQDLTGKQIQIFLGSASDELTALIAQHRVGEGNHGHLRQLPAKRLLPGASQLSQRTQKLLSAWGDAGFFRAED